MWRVVGSREWVMVTLLLGAVALACRPTPREHPVPTGNAARPGPPSGRAPVVRPLDEKPLYSHKNEELIVRDFFRDRRNGFFLDVGCAWPITHSNTYYLEKHLDWSGVAVDALAEYGPAWRQKRPRSRFFSYLVSDHSDTIEPFYRSELPSVSSALKPRVAGRRDQGQEVPFQEIRVPTITLTRLLEQENVSRVDFLSLDIEGAELAALAGFDIARFRPELVCVEAKPTARDPLAAYFETHGYRRLERYLEHDQVNHYFAPKRTRASAD